MERPSHVHKYNKQMELCLQDNPASVSEHTLNSREVSLILVPWRSLHPQLDSHMDGTAIKVGHRHHCLNLWLLMHSRHHFVDHIPYHGGLGMTTTFLVQKPCFLESLHHLKKLDALHQRSRNNGKSVLHLGK